MKLELATCCLLFAASALRGDDFAELFREADSYTRQGNYEQAILDYKAALKIRPGAPEAVNNLAVAYYEAHKYAEAFDTASSIWQSHKELKSAALIAGMAAVQCNKPEEAIAPFEVLLSSEPSNRDASLGLASAFVALDELPRAIEIYRRETTLSPNDAQAWYGLAICYERMAEGASRKLSEMPGGSGYSKRLLAQYLQGAGDEKLAAEAFGEAEVSTAASTPEVGRQYQVARELADKSRRAFEQFINLAPDSWQAAVFLGDIERQHGKLAEALAHYRRAAEAQPGNAAPLLGMGTVYWEMGDFDHAVSCLKETLSIIPHSSQATFELANIAVRRRQNAEAVTLLEQFLKLQPDASAARADLGRAYFHLGQYEKATAELSKASEADERGDVHYQLSIALRKLGRIREADEALRRSSQIRQSQLQREERLHAAH